MGRLIVAAIAGSILLLQLLLLLRLLINRSDSPRTKTARLALGLAALTPVLMGLLLVGGVHLNRHTPFVSTGLNPGEMQELMASAADYSFLGFLPSGRLLAGLALLALAGMGLLAALIVWLHRRKFEEPAAPGLVAATTVSLASGLLGGAVWIQYWAALKVGQAHLSTTMNPSDAVAASMLEARLPMWLLPAMASVAVMAGGLGMLALGRNIVRKLENMAVVASMLVLAIGATAFVATRWHAQDMRTNLPLLLTRPDPDKGLSVPVKIKSAVLGPIARRVDDRPMAAKLKLPTSTSTAEARWAVSVILTQGVLVVEGNVLTELQDGTFADTLIDRSSRSFLPLNNLLAKFREIEAKEGNGSTGNETVISLQADSSLPWATVHTVLHSAALAGFPNSRLVVEGKREDVLFKRSLSAINAHLPLCKKRPTIEPAAEVEPAQPEGDPTQKSAVSLEIRIKPEGFKITAQGDLPGADLEALATEIPASGGNPDYKKLASSVLSLHERFPQSDTALVIPHDATTYQQVINTLDTVRDRITDPGLDRREALFSNLQLGSPADLGPAPPAPGEETAPPLKIVTYNVLADDKEEHLRSPKLLKILRDSDADLIALQEVSPWFIKRLKRQPWMRKRRYRHTPLKKGRRAPGGLWLLSKHKIEATKVIPLKSKQGRKALIARVRIDGRPIGVAVVHLDSFLKDGPSRATQLELVFKELTGAEEAILLGDVNFGVGAEPESGKLDPAFVDAWSAVHPDKPGFTWNIEKSPMALAGSFPGETSRRLDRILIKSKLLTPTAARILGDEPATQDGRLFPSDHFGLLVELQRPAVDDAGQR